MTIFQEAAHLWAQMRREYGDYLEQHMAAAEHATNGVLLNERGRTSGISSERLFLTGPSMANAYASRELLDFWQDNPRMTLAQFEQQWLATKQWGATA